MATEFYGRFDRIEKESESVHKHDRGPYNSVVFDGTSPYAATKLDKCINCVLLGLPVFARECRQSMMTFLRLSFLLYALHVRGDQREKRKRQT